MSQIAEEAVEINGCRVLEKDKLCAEYDIISKQTSEFLLSDFLEHNGKGLGWELVARGGYESI